MKTKCTSLTHQDLAILVADVSEYSRLAESAEDETHLRMRAIRVDIVDPCVVFYRGRIVKNTGDGFIAAFDSCADAVRCSLQIQNENEAGENLRSADRRIRFRMGLNFGEAIVEQGDIFGTTVNVAARLEQCAPPGGIVISGSLRDMAGTNIEVPVEELGSLHLKNISRRVRAYALRLGSIDSNLTSAARGRAIRRAKIPGIAVLPFRTTGVDPDDLYFGEGMVDDIILALSNIRGLMVIARTSALAYRSGSTDRQQIGQDLGVRYVLNGSVRRSASDIRITSELIDIQKNSLIWVDRYSGAPHELFDLQDRIATRIVWSIAPQIREAELKRAIRKRPENMNAYDLVLQAINLLYRMNFADFSRAGELLRMAIAADDGYALAYVYAALWQVHRIAQGWTYDFEADAIEATRLATAAVKRDPADGFALAVEGHVRAMLFREFDVAKEIFERAVSAAPGNAMAWALSSGVYSYTGDGRAALERAQRGLRLSPVDTQAYFYLSFLAMAHYVNNNYDEAIIWCRKGLGANPRLCANLRGLAVSLAALDRVEEARQVGRILLDVQPYFRLSNYARACPFNDDLRTTFLDRLRIAGLPE